LENTIERAVALSNQGMLTPQDLPLEVRQTPTQGTSLGEPSEGWAGFAGMPPLEEIKKRYVQHVLNFTQGNMSRAAEILDIDRRSLYRMLERYNVAPVRHE
jgi:DNA-binding NtrC family response regulator